MAALEPETGATDGSTSTVRPAYSCHRMTKLELLQAWGLAGIYACMLGLSCLCLPCTPISCPAATTPPDWLALGCTADAGPLLQLPLGPTASAANR